MTDDVAIRLAVAELIAAYADCIDDDRLEDWPDFFVDKCRYLITDHDSHEAGLRHGVIYCASRGMLVDRVVSLRRVLMFEKHRYRHVTAVPRLVSTADGVAVAHTSFIVVRIMHDGATSLFATGRYLDRIDVTGTAPRFIERVVVLDSQKIDTLLVIPL